MDILRTMNTQKNLLRHQVIMAIYSWIVILQLLDSLSPTHRMWSDGRWNKFTIAHGCYWKKCSFCDIHLDYISRYVPAQTNYWLMKLKRQSNKQELQDFIFVDEAAPPKALKNLLWKFLNRNLPFILGETFVLKKHIREIYANYWLRLVWPW